MSVSMWTHVCVTGCENDWRHKMKNWLSSDFCKRLISTRNTFMREYLININRQFIRSRELLFYLLCKHCLARYILFFIVSLVSVSICMLCFCSKLWHTLYSYVEPLRAASAPIMFHHCYTSVYHIIFHVNYFQHVLQSVHTGFITAAMHFAYRTLDARCT